jgi:hypothetical protein
MAIDVNLKKKLDIVDDKTTDDVLQVEAEVHDYGELIIARAVVTINRSIKMAEYKYYKPGIELTGIIPKGMAVSDAVAQLKDLARMELQVLIDEEKGLYMRAGEVSKLERIIDTYEEDSTEYQLAWKELHGKMPSKSTGDTLA